MHILRNIPAALQALIGDATLDENREGHTGTSVFRLERQGQPDQYLKVGERYSEDDLAAELSRMIWLRGRLPVPEVLYWSEHGTRQYLLMTAIPGLPAYDDSLSSQLPMLIRLYADGLRQIHDVPVEGCPFDMRQDVRIAQAGHNLQAGLVTGEDFDPQRQGRAPQSLFRELMATRPSDEDPVFTHGDYCIPNVIINPEPLSVSGFIDWGRAGVADRYMDLALAARSIDYNFGSEWIPLFFEAYGIDPDPAKRAFYQLLDEFF
jgi:aminoglycoside phosphotransferase